MEPLPPISKGISIIFREEQQRGCIRSNHNFDAIASMAILVLSPVNGAITEKKHLYANIVGNKVTL